MIVIIACKGCGVQESSSHIPPGWLCVEQVEPPGADREKLRVGWFCSTACLASYLLTLEAPRREVGCRAEGEGADPFTTVLTAVGVA